MSRTESLKSRNLGTYYKNRTDMFDVLLSYMDDAIRNDDPSSDRNAEAIPVIRHRSSLRKP